MIALSAPTFDPLGHVLIDDLPQSSTREVGRRVNRVATLDLAGAVVNDAGHRPADRDMRVVWRASDESYDAVARLLRLYPRITLACASGMFSVVPSRLDIDDEGRATLSVLIMEELG